MRNAVAHHVYVSSTSTALSLASPALRRNSRPNSDSNASPWCMAATATATCVSAIGARPLRRRACNSVTTGSSSAAPLLRQPDW
ncbi:MAG: hypothetical protein HRT86_08755 [Ilumatobacteraceae bacterium]|nr:hypothetical protein [Ilumatobacteraceae bacterium]